MGEASGGVGTRVREGAGVKLLSPLLVTPAPNCFPCHSGIGGQIKMTLQ